jgi:hypothetical protein
VEKFGMTAILREDKGEGSSGDSIVILSNNKIPVNRRCFLPLNTTQKTVIPKLIHL